QLAWEVADGLRKVGFKGVRPQRDGPGETRFQGGLGPKRVDVSYADGEHGLMLAISLKSIVAKPFGKNLTNRFYDLAQRRFRCIFGPPMPSYVHSSVSQWLGIATPPKHAVFRLFSEHGSSLGQSQGAKNMSTPARSSRTSR